MYTSTCILSLLLRILVLIQERQLEQLSADNQRLTKQLLDFAHASPETLVIEVSPELW